MLRAIEVVHNVEMGHRLSQQPNSKCFHLHGHSWYVTLTMSGLIQVDGMIVDFGWVKKLWREYLDTNFDHHMVLNPEDVLVAMLGLPIAEAWGITPMPVGMDPTVENIAALWMSEAIRLFPGMTGYRVHLREAATNAAVVQTGELE